MGGDCEVFFSRWFVVYGKGLYECTRRVTVFFCGNPRTVDYQFYVVEFVEVLALDLCAVAQANPAAHTERASKLLDLHERWFLSGWWIPFFSAWASF
jgi:hypothetical protein